MFLLPFLSKITTWASLVLYVSKKGTITSGHCIEVIISWQAVSQRELEVLPAIFLETWQG